MRVVDLRPSWERWARRAWGGRPTARPDTWSRLWGGLVVRRLGNRGEPPRSPFLISIGNLSLGGSGKTPVTGRLALDLASSGLKPAVLTRGYRSALRRPTLVDPSRSECGDEARLLAGQLGAAGAPVVQAADRTAGLSLLLAEAGDRDVVLVEDGFQTRGLGRHLDILILDAWDCDDRGLCRPLAGPVFPRGGWREPATAARRAGIWLLETSDETAPAGPPGHLVKTFSRACRLVGAEDGTERKPPAEPWAALAGIARPEALERDAFALVGRPAAMAIRCGDHEPYSDSRIREIAEHLAAVGVTTLVTTAKDWVKLEGRIPPSWQVLLVVQTVHWGAHDDALPELVRKRVARHMEGAGG